MDTLKYIEQYRMNVLFVNGEWFVSPTQDPRYPNRDNISATHNQLSFAVQQVVDNIRNSKP